MKCLHCGAREALDTDGFCLDYDACIERKPLAGTPKPQGSQPQDSPSPL